MTILYQCNKCQRIVENPAYVCKPDNEVRIDLCKPCLSDAVEYMSKIDKIKGIFETWLNLPK